MNITQVKSNNDDLKRNHCPNMQYSDGRISIGEFKTSEDANAFSIHGIWCVNREADNKFNAYKAQGTRIMIVCDWSRGIQDCLKFVLALIHNNGKIYYWDMNDLPMYLDSKNQEYEKSIGKGAVQFLRKIAHSNNTKPNLNCNRTIKQPIRLTESQFRQVIKESVVRILTENKYAFITEGKSASNERAALHYIVSLEITKEQAKQVVSALEYYLPNVRG